MAETNAEQIAERAYNLGLVDQRQLRSAWDHFSTQDVSGDEFLQFMVRREFLTNYQVERLRNGDRSGYFYGDYKMLYMAGAGTFARVFRAAHRSTGRIVAVKVLRARYSDNPSMAREFVQEGELGRTLRHPNIVPIFEVHSKGYTHYMVMEFVEGQNLREFLRMRKKLTPEESTRITTDICRALQYANERGLSHRDLKLTNVLVSSQGRAKLVDFGLAGGPDSMIEQLGEGEKSQRTIDYAALERITGARRDDMRSDLYFVGCMYYHMLTGTSPITETRDRTKRLSRDRFLNVVPVQEQEPAVPSAVAIVVRRAMELSLDERYQSPHEMLADLKIASERLAAGTADQVSTSAPRSPAKKHSVMVVESQTAMQNVFRNGFKKAGWRVLITSDGERAVNRFFQDSDTADCIIFNAQSLGEEGVVAFNRLTEDSVVEQTPAILLLDPQQAEWESQAQTSDKRVVVQMPIKMKELREKVAALLDLPAETESDGVAAQ